jgi:hypothetical protein
MTHCETGVFDILQTTTPENGFQKATLAQSSVSIIILMVRPVRCISPYEASLVHVSYIFTPPQSPHIVEVALCVFAE